MDAYKRALAGGKAPALEESTQKFKNIGGSDDDSSIDSDALNLDNRRSRIQQQ